MLFALTILVAPLASIVPTAATAPRWDALQGGQRPARLSGHLPHSAGFRERADSKSPAPLRSSVWPPRAEFVARRSSLVVRRSEFVTRRSSLVARRSSL
jgi:hypothetical protein